MFGTQGDPMNALNQQSFQTATAFDAREFAEIPDPRCPCLLLLDTSGSMSGQPIAE